MFDKLSGRKNPFFICNSSFTAPGDTQPLLGRGGMQTLKFNESANISIIIMYWVNLSSNLRYWPDKIEKGQTF